MGRAVSGGSIAFDDLNGQSQIGASRDVQAGGVVGRGSRTFSRTGLITYSSIDALIAECFPAPPSLPGQLPGVSHLYCDNLTAVPFGTDPVPATCPTLTFPTYDTAQVTITYSTLPYDASDLITRRYSFSMEFMSLPSTGLRWESQEAGEVVETEDIVAQKRISMVEHSLTYHRVTSVPWAAIRANIGKVNDGTYEGAADQTLLFAGADISFTFSSNGTQTWTLDYRFQERRVHDEAGTGASNDQVYGWNHFYRPETKEWERLVDDDGNPVYPTSADFADLFS